VYSKAWADPGLRSPRYNVTWRADTPNFCTRLAPTSSANSPAPAVRLGGTGRPTITMYVGPLPAYFTAALARSASFVDRLVRS
jgi:hypothetical protein